MTFLRYSRIGLAGLFVLLLIMSAAAQTVPLKALYDLNWHLQYYLKDNVIYSQDWQIQYYVRDDSVFDKRWVKRYYLKDNALYDWDWHRQYYIREFRPLEQPEKQTNGRGEGAQ